jgi:hypothetical protein
MKHRCHLELGFQALVVIIYIYIHTYCIYIYTPYIHTYRERKRAYMVMIILCDDDIINNFSFIGVSKYLEISNLQTC